MIKKLLFLISISFFSCQKNQSNLVDENQTTIKLKWNKSYESETIENARIGLSWCYSMIGAKVLNSVVLPEEKSIFTVDINQIILTENTKNKLKKLHQKIKQSQTYKQNKSIDLGRYISLLIGASEHYYAFVNIPKKLDNLLVKYKLNPSKGYVNNSSVSLKHRIFEYSNQEKTKQLFLSKEFDATTNKIVEYETIEIMENGQLKFGIFNEKKKRINVANSKHTNAGKPAKCMWCHESNINKLFRDQDNFDGFLTNLQLNDTLVKFNNSLKKQQNSLKNGVKFSNKQEHTQLELAYITFMQPSALRLSNEWNLAENEVKKTLENLPTHTHEEFPFLGNLYDRNEVEKYAPYKSLGVSTKIREASKNEVNYID